MPLEKERRNYFSFGNILTLLGMAAAVAVSYADNRVENARQKERVDNLKVEVQEIKDDVKETKRDVQTILRKLDTMEATQRAERRDRRPVRSETDR